MWVPPGVDTPPCGHPCGRILRLDTPYVTLRVDTPPRNFSPCGHPSIWISHMLVLTSISTSPALTCHNPFLPGFSRNRMVEPSPPLTETELWSLHRQPLEGPCKTQTTDVTACAGWPHSSTKWSCTLQENSLVEKQCRRSTCAKPNYGVSRQ